MANKTPRLVIRKVPQTVAEWQDIVRFLNRTIEAGDLAIAITAHETKTDPHPQYETKEDAARNALPVGTVILWHSQNAPTNFLLADGSEASREACAALFAEIGTKYGAGDGVNTFNLPNIEPVYL